MTLVCMVRTAPQVYQSQHRGIMDEALKKFYFDLYDGETDGLKTDGQESEPASQSFNIDEYFDSMDTSNNINNEKQKQEKDIFIKPSISDRSTSFHKPKQNIFAAAKPTSSPAFSQAAVPGAPAATAGTGRDPTFVLSRLLFHLSQLPQL